MTERLNCPVSFFTMKKKNYFGGKPRKAKATANTKAQKSAEYTHSNEGGNYNAGERNQQENLTEAEEPIVKRAYELAPEWRISVIARRKFMALPSAFQNGAGKEACVKEALAAHKELIPDPTRYWIWLVDETAKLIRVWDFEEVCEKAGRNPLTVAQHLILEGKAVCNAVRMEGLEAYGSKIRMFVEPLFHDEFKLFGDKGTVAKPVEAPTHE